MYELSLKNFILMDFKLNMTSREQVLVAMKQKKTDSQFSF